MTPVARIPLRVVFYRDADDPAVLVAHCLEFDLLGHGADRPAALRMLGEAIATQHAAAGVEGLLSPAPAELMMRYALGRDVAAGEFLLPPAADYELGVVDAREYEAVPA